MSPRIDESMTSGLIKNYLDKRDDFDLELYVLRSLNESGWATEHSGSYVDPVAQNVRQFDVSAWKDVAPDCAVHMSAECKNISARYPLVISALSRNHQEAYHDVLWSTPHATSGRGAEALASRINVSHQPSHLYSAERPVGKSATQPDLEKDGKVPADENTYSKWAQAIAASGSKIPALVDHILSKPVNHYVFLLPVLIVSDATLWIVPYQEDGRRFEPQKADEALLYVDRKFPFSPYNIEYSITHLQICTRSGFTGFLNRLDQPGTVDRIFDPLRRNHLRGLS